MSHQEQHLCREDLVSALNNGWKHFLPQFKALSEEEQRAYAQQQGYARAHDVLAHIFAWRERTMQRSSLLLAGQTVPSSNDVDAFNAEVVAHYQTWTLTAIEETFARTVTRLERFIIDLPETALENERIALWLHIDVIDHYKDQTPSRVLCASECRTSEQREETDQSANRSAQHVHIRHPFPHDIP